MAPELGLRPGMSGSCLGEGELWRKSESCVRCLTKHPSITPHQELETKTKKTIRLHPDTHQPFP